MGMTVASQASALTSRGPSPLPIGAYDVLCDGDIYLDVTTVRFLNIHLEAGHAIVIEGGI